MSRRLAAWLLAMLPFANAQAGEATGAAQTAATPGAQVLTRTFKEMSGGGFDLRGLDNNAYLAFGVRLDEVVRSARLRLQLNYSPAMLENLSHIKVYLNNEVVGVITLPRQATPGPVLRELDIDPRYFSDFNQLRLQLVGHYTSGCEDPSSSSLWAGISRDSALVLGLAPLTLQNDLSLLPAPFFDRRDHRRLDLPFVLASQPDLGAIEAAGIAASWFGAEAGARGARFPVSLGSLPARNAVVFVRNGEHIAGLRLPQVQAPTVDIISLAGRPAVKYLVVRGRDAADLRMAASALALGQVLMSGAQTRILSLDMGAPRAPYDAPNWIRTDRPVTFGELVRQPWELQRTASNRDPMRIGLRLPPDLFTWRIRGIEMDLRYRYTPPVRRDSSTISVFLNNQLVRAYNLEPDQREGRERLSMSLLDEGSIMAREHLSAPPFHVGARNELQIHYTPEITRHDLCSTRLEGGQAAAVDPDSSIDFSRYPHYIIMPSLSAFAQSGFPFTRLADLAQTAIIMPDKPGAADISALFGMMGRFGAATGYPGVRVSVHTADVLSQPLGKDLLLLGSGTAHEVLKRWQRDMPSYLGQVQRMLKSSRNLQKDGYRWLTPDGDLEARRDIRLSLAAGGRMGALIGFESPLRQGRSVISMTASDADALADVFAALEDSDRLARLQGDVALVSGDRVDSFRIGKTYELGHLPIWTRLWLIFSDRPVVLAVAAILVGLLVAMLMFFGLNFLARRRLVK